MVSNNFNRIAWCYDFLARLVFGDKLKIAQRLVVPYLNDGDKLLIIGGGSGWIINEILKVKKVREIDYVEASEAMLKKAKAITIRSRDVKLNFIHGDENSISSLGDYDRILACYFFDMFQQERLDGVVSTLVSSLKPEGKLLVVDFNCSSTSPFSHRLILKIMYAFFNLTCALEAKGLLDFKETAKRHGLFCESSVATAGGLIRSEVYGLGG